jgi:hypothetical protein
MIADWITGLSMKKFAADNLWCSFDLKLVEKTRAAIARTLQQGEVWIGRQTAGLPSLNIRLADELNFAFFRKATPQLKKLLRRSRIRVTLAVDALPAEYLGQLETLLQRLSKYGDRVFVQISEAARENLTIDLSAFQLVLVPAPAKAR